MTQCRGQPDRRREILLSLVEAKSFSAEALDEVMAWLLREEVSSEWLSAFLMGVCCRGISQEELFSAAQFLRRHIAQVARHKWDVIDVCGTGGDRQQTLNVSTAVALVLGAMGVPCAKHGGRASSSRSGARDVLEALKLPQWTSPRAVAQHLKEDNLVFLAASFGDVDLTPLIRARKALGMASLFNLLGPLLNPLRVNSQMIGVFSPVHLEKMARTASQLGVERVWSCCGHSSYGEGTIDEITLSGESEIFAVEYGHDMRYRIDPEMFGFSSAPISEIRGGDSFYNASAIEELADGCHSAYRDTVIMNAAMALHVSGHRKILSKHDGKIDKMALKENVASIAHVLDTGRVRSFIDRLRSSAKSDEEDN